VIIFWLKIVGPRKERLAVVRTLNSMLGPTRVAPGCPNARLYAEFGDANVLVLIKMGVTRSVRSEP
jgi:hypothetical protein